MFLFAMVEYVWWYRSEREILLQAASEGGHGTIMKLLLWNDVNVNVEPARHTGRTALQAALGGGKREYCDVAASKWCQCECGSRWK